MKTHRLLAIFNLCLVLTFLVLASPSRAASNEINVGHSNKLAVGGYDVVTYWKGGKPQEGSKEFSAEYKGATWVFISEEHRALFLADPAKYAPQYGGYCAYAASRNYVADVDPLAWRIWKDKLYLNYSPGIRRKWAGEIDENIRKGDGNWPQLIKGQ